MDSVDRDYCWKGGKLKGVAIRGTPSDYLIVLIQKPKNHEMDRAIRLELTERIAGTKKEPRRPDQMLTGNITPKDRLDNEIFAFEYALMSMEDYERNIENVGVVAAACRMGMAEAEKASKVGICLRETLGPLIEDRKNGNGAAP